jgi:hypothetical protein
VDDGAVTSDAGARAAELLALIAGPDRLEVVAAMVLGARTPEQIAERSGIGLKRTWQCLTRLENARAVSRSDALWRVEIKAVRDAARAGLPERVHDDHGASDPGAAAVLRTFIKDGRLTSIPAVHHKRLVVLDHIVRVFEPGRRYTEAEVNAVLRAFHPDTAALRRYLVDEGMLSRESGVYWRSGGTVLVD